MVFSLTVLQSHTYSQNDICFFSYHSLTNNEYIIINKHYYIFIAGTRSVTLMMVLPNSISKLTFTDALHIPMLGANLISLSVLYHKGALVQS